MWQHAPHFADGALHPLLADEAEAAPLPEQRRHICPQVEAVCLVGEAACRPRSSVQACVALELCPHRLCAVLSHLLRRHAAAARRHSVVNARLGDGRQPGDDVAAVGEGDGGSVQRLKVDRRPLAGGCVALQPCAQGFSRLSRPVIHFEQVIAPTARVAAVQRQRVDGLCLGLRVDLDRVPHRQHLAQNVVEPRHDCLPNARRRGGAQEVFRLLHHVLGLPHAGM
eukprot:scaffold40070_cov37-Phaeocystis_antarctica.AAC.2